jgi:Contact-dependent growth inhibition CdiA C-terminal domain
VVFGPDGGPPIPVRIQPEDFHDVAQQFVDASSTVYQVLTTLSRVLDGFRGPAGVDSSAKQFDASYRPAVAGVVDGVNRAVNLLGDIGLGIDTAARNHWNADAAATPHGAPAPPWTAVDTGLVLPQSLSVPSLVGSPTAVLPPPLADSVPMGHVDDLQAIADAFRAARDTMEDVCTGLHNALEFLFSNNSSADLDALNEFWDHVGGNADTAILAALQRACDQIASAVQDYANWTVDAQNQILDAVGDFLKNAALGAVVAILLGMISDGIGALAGLLKAADELGEGGALVVAITGAATLADGRLVVISAAAAGVVWAMTAAINATPNPGIDPAEPESVTDTQEENAAEGLADKAQPDTGIHTEPSNAPDPNATPSGKPDKIGVDDSAAKKLALQRENESADILAKDGYQVEQSPRVSGSKRPDYRIEGQIFDCYAPTTTNIRSIADKIGRKVVAGQADRIVLNLSDSPVDLEKLSAQLRDWPIEGLKEIKVIDGQGNVIDFYP